MSPRFTPRPLGLTCAARWCAWPVLAGLLALTGCSPAKGDISGEVTYNGEPISVGRINFLSEVDQKEVFFSYIVRGKYTIKGCIAGPVKISVESFEPPDPEQLKNRKSKTMPPEMAKRMAEPPPEIQELANGPRLKHIVIPLRYSNPESSNLTYEVTAGPQTYNLPLAP